MSLFGGWPLFARERPVEQQESKGPLPGPYWFREHENAAWEFLVVVENRHARPNPGVWGPYGIVPIPEGEWRPIEEPKD